MRAASFKSLYQKRPVWQHAPAEGCVAGRSRYSTKTCHYQWLQPARRAPSVWLKKSDEQSKVGYGESAPSCEFPPLSSPRLETRDRQKRRADQDEVPYTA